MPPSVWPSLLSPSRWPLPGGCWICRDWGRARLCDACLSRFAPARLRCPRCALPLRLDAPVCPACLREPLPLEAVHAALDYEPPWDGLLKALKYERALGLVPAMAELVTRDAPPPPADCFLLPVPLHPARWRERGYNQSQLLAQALGERLALQVATGLIERVIDTPPQARLSRRERLANLRQAFALRGPVPQRHVLLIDDVMTTGATLATLAGLLRAAGAPGVSAWVIARTPEPDMVQP